jgi:hypothetical protein
LSDCEVVCEASISACNQGYSSARRSESNFAAYDPQLAYIPELLLMGLMPGEMKQKPSSGLATVGWMNPLSTLFMI